MCSMQCLYNRIHKDKEGANGVNAEKAVYSTNKLLQTHTHIYIYIYLYKYIQLYREYTKYREFSHNESVITPSLFFHCIVVSQLKWDTAKWGEGGGEVFAVLFVSRTLGAGLPTSGKTVGRKLARDVGERRGERKGRVANTEPKGGARKYIKNLFLNVHVLVWRMWRSLHHVIVSRCVQCHVRITWPEQLILHFSVFI